MPATVVVGTQWGDEGKGKLTDLLAGEMDLVVRYQGGHNAGHRIVVDGEAFALQLVPERDPLPPHHPGHRQRRGGRPGGAAGRARQPGGQGGGHQPAGGQRQRPPDHAVPPGARPGDRALPGQERPGHHQAGHRPGLRRQGGPGRPAGPGPARPQDLPPEARGGPEGEERRPGQGLQPPAALGRRHRRALPRRVRPPGRARWSATPWAWSTTPWRPGATCSWRAPRPPSSTSTTGPIPSSPRPTRWPAAPAPAPASGPRHIDRVIGIAKAYVTRVGAGPFPTELPRRHRRPAGRAGPRVRDQHRPAPPLRVVRRRHGPPGGAAELAVGGGPDQARRARHLRDGQGLRGLRGRAASGSATSRTTSRPSTRSPRSTRSCPAGAPT